MLELVYNEGSNAAFLEQQSWLQKSIQRLDGLGACKTLATALRGRRDTLKAQLEKESEELREWQPSQWMAQFAMRPVVGKSTFDIDTGMSVYMDSGGKSQAHDHFA